MRGCPPGPSPTPNATVAPPLPLETVAGHNPGRWYGRLSSRLLARRAGSKALMAAYAVTKIAPDRGNRRNGIVR